MKILDAVTYKDKELYNRVKQEADKKFSGNSYVKNLWVIREYKKRGGKVEYEGKKPSGTSIKKQIRGSNEVLMVSYTDECKPCSQNKEISAETLEEYKNDFLGMTIGSIKSIRQHADNILRALEFGDEKVKQNLTEPFLQPQVALAEDYMLTIHNYVMFAEENSESDSELDASGEEINENNFYLPEESDYVTKDEVEFEENEVIEYNLDETLKAAEYQGRKVTLNKPFRTPGGPKKFAVYTKNKSGNVIIVRFGDPNMKIKKNIPERRRSFRARHGCDTDPRAKDKTTAKYWSCRQW